MKQIGFILQVQPQQPVPFPGVAPWALGIFPSFMWLKSLETFATAGATIRELRPIPHDVISTEKLLEMRSIFADAQRAAPKSCGARSLLDRGLADLRLSA